MSLDELIATLKAAPQDAVLAEGFARPHSYRGYYDELAFEPAANVTVASMLAAAEGAIGKTFEGYKGGDYVMSPHTPVWLAKYGATGDMLSPLALRAMLATAAQPATTLRALASSPPSYKKGAGNCEYNRAVDASSPASHKIERDGPACPTCGFRLVSKERAPFVIEGDEPASPASSVEGMETTAEERAEWLAFLARDPARNRLFDASGLRLLRDFDRLAKEVERLTRIQEARDKQPDWEKLWAEQSERAEAAEAKLAAYEAPVGDGEVTDVLWRLKRDCSDYQVAADAITLIRRLSATIAQREGENKKLREALNAAAIEIGEAADKMHVLGLNHPGANKGEASNVDRRLLAEDKAFMAALSKRFVETEKRARAALSGEEGASAAPEVPRG